VDRAERRFIARMKPVEISGTAGNPISRLDILRAVQVLRAEVMY
jgi:hypothetical protein